MGQLNTTLEFYGSCDITAWYIAVGSGWTWSQLAQFQEPLKRKVSFKW